MLAGGTAARLGGAEKAALDLDGVTLLERALAACVSAVDVVVVGRRVPTSRAVTWTLEDPPLGGPAAGLLAGVDALLAAPGPAPDLVAVLAVDMPKVNAGTVARLTWAVEADPSLDGARLVDEDGRAQPLAAVYRVTALLGARPGRAGDGEHGLPVHRLVGGLTLADVVPVGDETRDVDTWADVEALRAPYQ